MDAPYSLQLEKVLLLVRWRVIQSLTLQYQWIEASVTMLQELPNIPV